MAIASQPPSADAAFHATTVRREQRGERDCPPVRRRTHFDNYACSFSFSSEASIPLSVRAAQLRFRIRRRSASTLRRGGARRETQQANRENPACSIGTC